MGVARDENDKTALRNFIFRGAVFRVAERASAAGEDLGVVMAFSIAELGGSV